MSRARDIADSASIINYLDGLTTGLADSPTFTGTVTAAALAVDTDVLLVDDTNNRVGINVASPAYELDIDGNIKVSQGLIFGDSTGYLYEGATDQINFRIGADGPYVTFKDVGSSVAEFGNASGALAIKTGASERMRIDSSGRVGIGTSSPSSSLTIREESANHEIIEISRPASDVGALYLGTVGTNDAAISANNSNLTFGIALSGVYAEKMRIDSSGNVGIGTSSPTATLHVLADNGDVAKISGATRSLYFGVDTGGVMLGTGATQTGNGFYFSESSNFIYAQTNSTERLRIDSSGNVGIGTTSPNISLGASGSTALTISASASARNGLIELKGTRLFSGDVVSYLRTFNNAGSTPLTDIRSIRGASDTTGELAFFTSNTERMRIDSSGTLIHKAAAVFNEDGGDSDFRVESTVSTAALFVDASTGNVGIRSSAPTSSLFVAGNKPFTWNATGIQNVATVLVGAATTTNNANSFAVSGTTHNSYYPAALVIDSQYGEFGTNSTNFDITSFGVNYPGWNGSMRLRVSQGTSTHEALRITPTDTIFNELSNNTDFRVESDSNTHMLFVDAGNSRVGIGTSDTSDVSLTVSGSMRVQSYNTNDAFINLAVGATAASLDQLYTIRIDNDVSNSFEIDDNTDGSEFFRYTPSVGIILNEESKPDNDFRVESDTRSAMLFVDASTDRVGINTDAPQQTLEVRGKVLIEANNSGLTVTPNNELILSDSDTTTNTDQLMGAISFNTKDASNPGTAAKIQTRATNSLGSGELQIWSGTAPTLAKNVMFRGDQVVFNEDSNDMDFRVESDTSTHALFVDAANSRVGINVTSPQTTLDVRDSALPVFYIRPNNVIGKSDTIAIIQAAATITGSFTGTGFAKIQFESESSGGGNRAGTGISFYTNLDGYAGTTDREVVRIDRSGNLLVGKTSSSFSIAGHSILSSGYVGHTRDGGNPVTVNRLTSDGGLVNFEKDGTVVGSIGSTSGSIFVGSGDTALLFLESGDAIRPADISSGLSVTRDNAIDLGSILARFDDIYATNGTIQTSDRNEKQDIESLSEAEQRVAVAAKGLLRKFRWKSAVEEKGDDARIHFGIIAQDLQAAFEAEGLDAGRYAMFIHSTWTDEETGEERSRMGVRYSELLAFIIAAL